MRDNNENDLRVIKTRKLIKDTFLEMWMTMPLEKIHVYHLNGQTVITLKNETEASGVAYCQATLVNEQDGKDIVTVNDVRYADEYIKVDGKWYIKKRRTTFLISENHEYQA